MSKIAYRFGHNEACQGASGYCNEVIEDRKYGTRVIQLLQEVGNQCINCTPPPMADANEELVYGVMAENNIIPTADLFISFHINAAGEAANGSETCVYENSGLANSISTNILNNLSKIGFYNRGIKERPDLYEPSETKAICIIVEPFFVTNKADVDRYNSNFEAFCRAIANGVDSRVTLQVSKKEVEVLPVYDFCEKYYLEMNPDVKRAGVNPYEHYVKAGIKEGRLGVPPIPKDWNEAYYLINNPDVNANVSTGTGFKSGLQHYQQCGWYEQRKWDQPDFTKISQEELNKRLNEELQKKKSEIKVKVDEVLR